MSEEEDKEEEPSITLSDKEYAVILKMRQGEFEKDAIFSYAMKVS